MVRETVRLSIRFKHYRLAMSARLRRSTWGSSEQANEPLSNWQVITAEGVLLGSIWMWFRRMNCATELLAQPSIRKIRTAYVEGKARAS